jgi:hypothetical protein
MVVVAPPHRHTVRGTVDVGLAGWSLQSSNNWLLGSSEGASWALRRKVACVTANGSIRVDPSSLAALANSIGQVAPELSTPYPPDVSACQSWGVASTLARFSEELEEHRRVVQEELQSVADAVIQTANDFSDYDAALVAEFDRFLPEKR